MNKDAKQRLGVFIKAGLPFTIAGMVIVFAGLYFIKKFFADSAYLTLILFGWLALFWFVYQPLFKRRIENVKKGMRH